MALGLECASQVNSNVEFAEFALDYYRALEKKGHGTKDFGYVY